MYKVYGSVASRAFRVLWMLEEIGEPYELITAAPQSDAIKAVNLSGKIPALQDGGATLSDSTAILTYLADKHGKLTHPAGSVARAHQDALTNTVLDECDSLLWASARYGRILPEQYRTEAMEPGLKWEFARNLNRLATRLDGPFLQGDQLTIADLILTHCLNWAISAKFPVENEKIDAYARMMRGREAFRAARANNPA